MYDAKEVKTMTVIITNSTRNHPIFNDPNQYRDTNLICICLIVTHLYFAVNKYGGKIVIDTIEVIIIGKLLAK